MGVTNKGSATIDDARNKKAALDAEIQKQVMREEALDAEKKAAEALDKQKRAEATMRAAEEAKAVARQAATRSNSSPSKQTISNNKGTPNGSTSSGSTNNQNTQSNSPYRKASETSSRQDKYTQSRTGLGEAQMKYDEAMRTPSTMRTATPESSSSPSTFKTTSETESKGQSTIRQSTDSETKGPSFVRRENTSTNTIKSNEFIKPNDNSERYNESHNKSYDSSSTQKNPNSTVETKSENSSSRVFQNTEDLTRERHNAATMSGLMEQEIEYQKMMRGIIDPEKSSQDKKISEQFSQIKGNEKTTIISGGNSGGTINRNTFMRSDNVGNDNPLDNQTMRVVSTIAPKIGIRSVENQDASKNIRPVAQEDLKIRTDDALEKKSDEVLSALFKMNGNNGYYGSSATGVKGVQVCGGRYSGKGYLTGFRTGRDLARLQTQTVATDYASIFRDKKLAEACGIVYDDKNNIINREQTLINGKVGKFSVKKIQRALENRGYSENDAATKAQEIYDNIHRNEVDYKSTSAHTNDNLQATLISANGNVKENEKIEIRQDSTGKMVVYKPIGLSKTDVAIQIEKPMRRMNSTSYYYMMGQVERGGGEAGRGLSEMRQYGRIAKSFLLPNVAAKINLINELQLRAHLNGFVIMNIKGKGQVTWTVGEAQQHLLKLGFDKDFAYACKTGDDFHSFAKSLLKADDELPDTKKLNANQRKFLETLSKSRAAQVSDRIKTINSVLHSYDIKPVADYGVYAIQKAIALKKNTIKKFGGADKVPAELMAVLNERIIIAKDQQYKSAAQGGKGKTLQLVMLMKNSMEKNGAEAGQGLSLSTKMISYAKKGVMVTLQATWATNMFIRELAQKLVLLTEKANSLAGRVIGKLGNTTNSKAIKGLADHFKNKGKKLQTRSDNFKKFNRNINSKKRELKNKIKDFFNRINPFAILKLKMRNAFLNRWNKLIGRKTLAGRLAAKFDTFLRGIASGFGLIGRAKAIIMKYLMMAGAVMLLIIFIAVLINTIAGAVAAMFNLNSQEYDTKQYLANDLKTYYEEDMQVILDKQNELTDSSYSPDNPHVDHVENVYITYEDFKDYDKYQAIGMDNESVDFFQSSNNGEIFSMANVKFDYDLGTLKDKWFSDDPKKNKQFKKVEEYMQQLYYGSHVLIVRIETHTHSSSDSMNGAASDAEEPEETYSYNTYDIYATYKTYYFDYLFDCELKTSPQREVSMASTTGLTAGYAQSWDSIYYALRKHGLSHNGAAGVMSNMAHESGDRSNWLATNGPNPEAGVAEGVGAYGICQWTSCGNRKGNMIAWCQSQGFQYNSTSGQLAYMLHEIDNIGSYNATKNAVYNTSKSAYDIGNIFGDNFEGYGGGEESTRGGLAETIASYYSDKMGGDTSKWEELMSLGDQIADLAIQSVGRIHYTQGPSFGYEGTRVSSGGVEGVWDVTDRSKGTDCSAFIVLLHNSVGITSGIPNTTMGYPDSGWFSVYETAPGDVLWTSGHAGICIGDGKTVELHWNYCSVDGNCSRDCGYGSVTSFTRAYRFWN